MKSKLAIILAVALLCAVAVPGSAAEPIKIGAFFALSGPAAPSATPPSWWRKWW